MQQTTGMSAEDHRAALIEHVGADGHVRDVGEAHLAVFRPGNGVLLVEFDEISAIRARRGGRPWSGGLARKRGYTTLTIAADGPTWFRDPALIAYFDGLTDEGVFDEYETVVFAGGGMGAYGAGAYSVASPGAVVVLVQPCATLDPSVAAWDPRFRAARRLPFGPRYGNAARMVDAAKAVFVLSDPRRTFDAMHAALFQGDHVTQLRAPHAGPDVWTQLERIKILDRIVAHAEKGDLTAQSFAQLWRGRREDPEWLARVLRALDVAGRPWLTALWTGEMLRRADNPVARRRLNAALQDLAAQGREPPSGLRPQPSDGLLLAGE
ncbi:MAG: phosphoadenosine phosphosulfate reductase [Pseudomonadota bacterium]